MIIMKNFIYSLSDPITKEIVYIGKTKNPIKRHKDHCRSDIRNRCNLDKWKNEIINQGLSPVMEILEEVYDDVDGKETEIKDMQLGVSLNADKVTFIPSYKPIIEVLKRDGEWAISIPYEVWSPRAEFANGVFFIGLDFKLESFISDKPDLQNIEARLNLILATSTNTIYE